MDVNDDMKQVLDELEKMRDEYAGLKEELDRQKIINGKTDGKHFPEECRRVG